MLIFVRKKVHLGDSLLGVLQMTEDRMNRMATSSPAIDRVLTLHALPAPVEKAIFLLGQRKEARQLSLTSNDVTSQFSPSISSTNQGTQEKVRYVQGTSDSYSIVPTILACKLSKYREVFTPATRWSAHGPHHTNACPWCVVCVVGALGSFPHCKGVNGSSENGAFEAPMEIQNKLSTFALHHVEVTTMH